MCKVFLSYFTILIRNCKSLLGRRGETACRIGTQRQIIGPCVGIRDKRWKIWKHQRCENQTSRTRQLSVQRTSPWSHDLFGGSVNMQWIGMYLTVLERGGGDFQPLLPYLGTLRISFHLFNTHLQWQIIRKHIMVYWPCAGYRGF